MATDKIAINVLQQNLSVSAPSKASQFAHHLSLLNHKADGQRKESLAYLISSLKESEQLPLPGSVIIIKVRPVLLDSSASVRSQAIKLLESLPSEAVIDNAEQLLLYAHVTMTHLSTSFRLVGLELLEWLLNVAGQVVVTAPGGWSRTLECLLSVFGWQLKQTTSDNSGWNATVTQPSKSVDDEKTKSKGLQVLALLLRIGMSTESLEEVSRLQLDAATSHFPLFQVWQHSINSQGNPYGYLGLFDEPTGHGRYEDVTDRCRFFDHFAADVVKSGIERLKQEGGKIGRASVEVEKALRNSRVPNR
jgi:pre-rRNA-processing protein IPI1